MRPQDITVGQPVAHPNWDGRRREGVVQAIVNAWHAVVLFDGWNRPVTAAIGSLEALR